MFKRSVFGSQPALPVQRSHAPRQSILMSQAKLLLSASMLVGFVGSAWADEIIDNGTIQLGINDNGELITGGVGITFIPSLGNPEGGDGIEPGCACEGWGIADDGVGTGFGASQSNGSSGTGTSTLVVSGTGTQPNSTGSSALVTTTITEGGLPFAEVVHNYMPSASNNLYEAAVSITNIGTTPIAELIYRRVMDWDVPPTTFNEFVTIQGWPATNLVASSDDGFENPNPNIAELGPISAPLNSNFEANGPDDHGAAFDFSFGTISPGEGQDFSIFYGAAPTIDDALIQLGVVGAEVYSLGIPGIPVAGDPSNPAPNPTGAPNVFIFGFAGVGGTPVGPATGPAGEMEILRAAGILAARTVFDDPLLRMSGGVHGGEVAGGSGEPADGFRFIFTGGLAATSFDTQAGQDADVDISHGGVAAEFVSDALGNGSESARMGIGFDVAGVNAELNNSSSVKSNVYTLYGYAANSFDNGFYVDGLAGYSWLDNSWSRRPVESASFSGDMDGGQFGALLRGGWDTPIALAAVPGSLTAGVFGSLQYISQSLDGFEEEDGPTAGLTVDEQSASLVSTRLGEAEPHQPDKLGYDGHHQRLGCMGASGVGWGRLRFRVHRRRRGPRGRY